MSCFKSSSQDLAIFFSISQLFHTEFSIINFFGYTELIEVLFLQKEKHMFQKVKGVADNFFNMNYWTSVIHIIESHLHTYNFFQIDIPILEHVNLFERGLGYETDVVSKEMFVMQPKTAAHEEKSSEKDLICLRPEATAGTMRAFLEVQSQVKFPARVYCYGPMFRYERPQKGRLRQFHQLNMEILGAASIDYDAQYIAMLHTLFTKTLGIEQIILKLNFLGHPADRKQFTQAFITFLTPQTDKLCNTCNTRLHKNPLRILDCKSIDCQKICQNGPKLADFFSLETKAEWQQLQATLQYLKISFVIDTQLVRGLDYYNKTVFEFVSENLGAQNTFCGGGRYDGLAEQLGSKTPVPALGCAIGLERLIIILQSQNKNFTSAPKKLICITAMDQKYHTTCLQLAENIVSKDTNAKFSIEMLLDETKIKHSMKQANNLNATWCLIIGDHEAANKQVTIKNMINGEQQTVQQANVMQHLN